jgi:hypothetical protein
MLSDRVGREDSGMNLKATPKRQALYVVNTASGGQALYLASDIPSGLTIDQYRRSRARRPNRWERLKRLAGGAQAAA